MESEETYRELLYSFASFLAVFFPVAITMILTGLTVVYINDGTNGDGAGDVATLPTVRDESAESSSAGKASAAALNALVIVGIITGVTFLMVLLYKFNCYRILFGWLMLSTCSLLVLTTSYPVQVAFLVYNVPFDAVTFWLFFYNFGICGVLAIFYQQGMYPLVGQFYLVTVSVVMAWVLLRVLPEYTSWALLVLLALYDLCAVLTPCGPLNLLIGIASEKEERGNTNELPGLLYEARVRHHDDLERPPRPARRRPDANEAAGVAPLGGIMFMANASPPGPQRTASIEFESQRDLSNEDGPPTSSRQDADSEREASPPRAPRPAAPLTPADLLERDSEAFADRNSIKLGLGDFVFYSVLVGRAALQGFSTFAAVFITVFAGLAGTLLLLAVYQRALPALPISILFGVPLFFLCELLVSPMTVSLALEYRGI
ncbi:Presenilin-1 [Hondaea fermentalgiana]|uniref:Presenilin n=1 Tax=Hondaea fermentalgiana TaxID=2315210 RepID=A0A2R5GFB5_9STRA|nr:Presenilin-1 [Hondaea fermentalgiana]|eukprot:GBG28428.1 Presenilin-1 [Hondaea fermentalgiana]